MLKDRIYKKLKPFNEIEALYASKFMNDFIYEFSQGNLINNKDYITTKFNKKQETFSVSIDENLFNELKFNTEKKVKFNAPYLADENDFEQEYRENNEINFKIKDYKDIVPIENPLCIFIEKFLTDKIIRSAILLNKTDGFYLSGTCYIQHIDISDLSIIKKFDIPIIFKCSFVDDLNSLKFNDISIDEHNYYEVEVELYEEDFE